MAQIESETDFGPEMNKPYPVTDENGMFLMDFNTREEALMYILHRDVIIAYQKRSHGVFVLGDDAVILQPGDEGY